MGKIYSRGDRKERYIYIYIYMKRVGIFLGLILMLFLISNVNVKANSSVDLTSAEYDDYYVNSDLIYDMSDVDNIAPFEYNGSTYTIDEDRDSLYNCNMT